MYEVSWAVSGTLIFALVLVAVALLFAVQGIKVVPQQTAWVVERLGKFHAVLNPGLNIIIPFIDRVAYRHSLKEIPLDTPSQVCITRDNTQLTVDGVLYFQVTDPKRASYGTSNYVIAITQLAQTTLRSVIGRMELDKTFEERDAINNNVVAAIDEAAMNWGVKVLRYEIKDLTPPAVILQAMQQQITAEREKRALIAASEGKKQEQINLATGAREAAIAQSEGEKQAEINKAEGQAAATLAIAKATAEAPPQPPPAPPPAGPPPPPPPPHGRSPSHGGGGHADRGRNDGREPAGRRKVRRRLRKARQGEQHPHRSGELGRHERHDRFGDEDRRGREEGGLTAPSFRFRSLPPPSRSGREASLLKRGGACRRSAKENAAFRLNLRRGLRTMRTFSSTRPLFDSKERIEESGKETLF